jgi:hypothetical protein
MEVQILNKNPTNFRPTVIISIKGNKPEVQAAESAIKAISGIETMSEGEARLAIQKRIDEHHLLASIMFDNNSVWSKKRIIDNLDKIIQAGVLWDQRPHEFRDADGAGRPIKVTHTQTEAPQLKKIGPLLLPSQGFRCLLSPYFYEFLHLCCGSIAHYDIHGWVTEYPTVEDLKKFFNRNEYGCRVVTYIQSYSPQLTDEIEIVKAIEARLYPFRTYMASKLAAKKQAAAAPLQTIKKP